MKRIITVLLFMLCIITTNANTPFSDMTRIMVISDPHILTEENAEKLNFNKGGKLDKMSPTIFAKAVETIIQARPQALLVCGDMTFNGEASGHTLMVSALSEIEAHHIPVLVIPGNHDLLNPFSEDESKENITPEQFKELYSAFGLGEDSDIEHVSRDVKSLSWSGSLKGTNLAIIGIDANIYEESAEFYSDGCIRKSTIKWMEKEAEKLRQMGKMVIVMVHQQLVEHLPSQSLLAQTTLLNKKHTKNPVGDEEEDVTLENLQMAFANAQIQYVLTGHFHIHHMQNKTVKNSSGEDFTLTELTTGGLSTYPNWMRTLVFDTKNKVLASSTSTMVQTKLGENDLQYVSKSEFTTWASENYSSAIASIIAMMNNNVDKYEIYDGTTLFQLNETAYPEVQYTRNFDNYLWQSLYIPFDLQFNDWCTNFDIARYNSTNGDSIDFTLLREGDILKKNTPAIIRLKGESTKGDYSIISSVKTSDKTIIMPVEDDIFLQSDISLHGTFSGLINDTNSNNNYTLSLGRLECVNNSANIMLQPQRWYITDNSGGTERSFSLNAGSALVKSNLDIYHSRKFINNNQVLIRNNYKTFNIKGQEIK